MGYTRKGKKKDGYETDRVKKLRGGGSIFFSI